MGEEGVCNLLTGLALLDFSCCAWLSDMILGAFLERVANRSSHSPLILSVVACPNISLRTVESYKEKYAKKCRIIVHAMDEFGDNCHDARLIRFPQRVAEARNAKKEPSKLTSPWLEKTNNSLQHDGTWW